MTTGLAHIVHVVSRRARRRASTLSLLIAVCALALTLAHPAAAAATETLHCTFDQGIKVDAQGRKYVVDLTGRGHTGYVQKADNGAITVIPGAGGVGKALRFPANCAGSGCPKALIEAA